MYRRVLTAGATAAVIIGAGTAALATTGSDTTSGSPTTSSTAAPGHAKKAERAGRMLRRAVHAQITTKGKDGTFVTHDIVTGTVTAVSATSITVQAADKTSETFVVNSATKVRLRTKGKGAPSTISKVATGDTVLVAGTGTTTMTAKHVVDIKK